MLILAAPVGNYAYLPQTHRKRKVTSFEEALNRLDIAEEDLKRLISAGDIRAFREGSNMRLDVADVEKEAEKRGIGSPVSEADASEVVEVEELDLDGADDGMVTTQLSADDTLLDLAVEEVAVEEVAVEEAPSSARSARSKRGGTSKRSSKTTILPGVEMTDEGGGMRAALVVTAIVLMFAIPFAMGMISGRPSGITQGIVDMFAN
ncbi:MAG: hypothetical protein CMJ93_02145 [Planctomycetes bacterium]|nr:hypothetical protein [Planctomycetota bacterium]